MAGWSSFNRSSSSSFTNVEIDYFDECKERLKKLFDEALLFFLEEDGSTSNNSHRPIPVILGNGVTVDLFKLFVLVREKKGFDSVTRQRLWETVAEKLGLDCSVSPSLRLVYSKYLNRMEKWAVEKSRIVNWDNQDSKKNGCYGGLLHELGNGFKSLLENGKCRKRNRAMAFGCKKHMEESSSSSGKRISVCSHESVDDDDESVVCVEEEGFDLSSEKQGDDLSEMLKWLTLVATCPHDPSIGVLPNFSRWKEFAGNKCWIQVTRAKKALMVQRDNTELRYQNTPALVHQTMHPSMYEDDRKSTGRLRYSIRRSHLSKDFSSSSCKELSIRHETADLVAGTSVVSDLQEMQRSYVSVGRHSQARVDKRKECGLDSDTKWLGTRIWPLEKEEALDHMIGKGRPDCCSCDSFLSGSVECIRFHIAEKRMELKRDIGDAFFHWRFNKMGEEVSLRWTEREEKKFKEMMILDPKCFWQKAKRCFRGKKREEIVSYYFNVFLINRRRYQNRVTPRQIDSDDEEIFGSVGNSFGRDAVASLGSDIMICSQNNQFNDLD